MSLTLVLLAEALQNDRAIQIKGCPLDGWTDTDLSPASLHEIKGWLKFGNIRIKPEPKSYWVVEGPNQSRYFAQSKGEAMRESAPGSTITEYREVQS